MKFTEQGEVALRIGAGTRGGLRHRLRFEIEDSGIGIPPEALARLFLAFEQGDGSMTRRYGGTGLGLAISRRLVQLMGGEIGVHGTPGQGSTFWFELEFSEAATAGPAPQVSAQVQGQRLGRDHGGKRILVVEDDPVNQGSRPHHAGGRGPAGGPGRRRRRGVRHAGARPYALILMDMQMPVMNGLEATSSSGPNPQRDHTHPGHDRQRLRRGSRTLPGGRHERPHHQTGGAGTPVPSPGRLAGPGL
ncbi:MAG: hypothetical protein IPJ99_01090 [Betaproteobacteria bacterium]|nr:hypothetical protein [Betaproteobacteria bacterium]